MQKTFRALKLSLRHLVRRPALCGGGDGVLGTLEERPLLFCRVRGTILSWVARDGDWVVEVGGQERDGRRDCEGG